MDKIYSEQLIEHYKNPRRFGIMEDPNLVGHAVNSLCGDELTVYVKNQNGIIVDALFSGSGCAICIGTMSMVIDEIINKKVFDVVRLPDAFALDKIGMSNDSSRIKCAILSIEAIKNLK